MDNKSTKHNLKKVKSEFSSWHVGVAAEAISAGQFARLGYDISVQYGADQPEYDLIISKGKDSIPLKISVKGSQDGSWGLTQNHLEKGKADYKNSIDKWLLQHGKRTIFCFVQFREAKLDELPRLYLATPAQVADQLKKTAKGRGDTILYENHTWKLKTAAGYGTTDKIPDEWKFSKERIEQLFK
jgi:hypothetical protein